MHILLVRHGESVDNVAGLYAGVRDSRLTNHGANQARRLGAHLVARAAALGPVARVFSSDLQRALRTAEAVVEAQLAASAAAGLLADSPSDAAGGALPAQEAPPLRVVQVPELRERDFRAAEGMPFGRGTSTRDAEPHADMLARARAFVQQHIAPLLAGLCAAPGGERAGCVVVVSHGLILNEVLRALLGAYGVFETPPAAGAFHPLALGRHLASWDNTAYLELEVVAPRAGPSASAQSPPPAEELGPARLRVCRVNVVDHLKGLRRTGGGIGSAASDSRQKPITSFFKPKAG